MCTDLVDYWARRFDANVLLVCFEDLRTQTRAHVERIARFLDLDCDEALLSVVLELSSSAFMERHPSKFDDHWLHELQTRRGSFGDFPLAPAVKVSLPQTEQLSAEVLSHLERRWEECVAPYTGAASYAELRQMHCEAVADGRSR